MTSGPDSITPVPRPEPAPSVVPRPPGLVLAPFRALRYAVPDTELPAVTSPPYDVVDADGAAALEQLSPTNVVRLILPREESHGQDRYACAAATLARWQAEGVLVPDPVPALYVYEQAPEDGGSAQRGLLGALALTPPEDRVVLPHEDTMAGPVADRLALYSAVRADLEPIFLLHEGSPGAAREALAAVDAQAPLVDMRVDGVRHRLWALTDPDRLAAVAADLAPRRAVIADGHHRYATYLMRQAAHHARGEGPGPWDAGLAFLVDAGASGPCVQAIHRVLPGQALDALDRAAAQVAEVAVLDGQDLETARRALAEAGRHGAAFLLADGTAEHLRLVTALQRDLVEASMPAGHSQAWRDLDVSVLHRYLVRTVWGLVDAVDTVQYAHDVAGALALARRTQGTAVLLNPTPVEAVTHIAGAGERMPRKSTSFTPKPRTGLVVRAYDV